MLKMMDFCIFRSKRKVYFDNDIYSVYFSKFNQNYHQKLLIKPLTSKLYLFTFQNIRNYSLQSINIQQSNPKKYNCLHFALKKIMEQSTNYFYDIPCLLLNLVMSQDYQGQILRQQQRVANQNQRKIFIQAALIRLKKKNEQFLQKLQSNTKWRKIYNGLLYNNKQSQLNKLISLQLCQAKQNQDVSFFNPFQKYPIKMCYNRINNQEKFTQQALYNLILLYDHRSKRDMNWNDIHQTAKSTVRALNLSGICAKQKFQCFQEQLNKRILQKQRFKGHPLDKNQIFKIGIQDMTPISQISS